MCILKSLKSRCGESNAPGTRAKLRMIPAESLLSTPKTKSQITDDPEQDQAGDTMIYDEPFEVKVGEKWLEYDIITNTGQLTGGMEGELGGRAFRNGLAFMIAGIEADKKEFAKCVANGCFVAMITDREDETHVYGRHDDPAFFETIDMDSGLQVGDRRATSYLLQTSEGGPPMSYNLNEHGIDLEPVTE